MRNFVLVCCLLGISSSAEAAVTINEIAWMGSTDSANHEWIELYNDGSATDVSGWTLTDGGAIDVTLTGSLGAGSYAVLERTSDASAPGTAFLIYTGALNNSGTTLTLRRADGSIEDQVAGGENWDTLGGDNTTKETAQYTSSGWITAAATPGAVNSTVDTSVVETKTTVSESTGARLAEPVVRVVEALELPGVTLQLEPHVPEQVFVNQQISFDVTPSGVGEVIQNSLQYRWNFGDLHTAEGKTSTHTFSYPGTYVVHVYAEYARQTAFETKEITVLPVSLSLTQNKTGDVHIHNDAPYAINLSEYRIRGAAPFELPADTWLLPRQTITVPQSFVAETHNQLIALYDTAGDLVASTMPPAFGYASPPSVERSTPQTPPVTAAPPVQNNFRFVETAEAEEVAVVESVIITSPAVALASSAPERNATTNWPIVGLIALLTVSCIVVLVQPLLKNDGLDSHDS